MTMRMRLGDRLRFFPELASHWSRRRSLARRLHRPRQILRIVRHQRTRLVRWQLMTDLAGRLGVIRLYPPLFPIITPSNIILTNCTHIRAYLVTPIPTLTPDSASNRKITKAIPLEPVDNSVSLVSLVKASAQSSIGNQYARGGNLSQHVPDPVFRTKQRT